DPGSLRRRAGQVQPYEHVAPGPAEHRTLIDLVTVIARQRRPRQFPSGLAAMERVSAVQVGVHRGRRRSRWAAGAGAIGGNERWQLVQRRVPGLQASARRNARFYEDPPPDLSRGVAVKREALGDPVIQVAQPVPAGDAEPTARPEADPAVRGPADPTA